MDLVDDESKITKLPVRFKHKDEERTLLQPWEVVGKKSCYHRQFIVDDKKAEVECADCGEKLNPIWVLAYLCNRESQWKESRRRYQEEMKRLDERSRTKCEHCEKMTRISRR